MADTNPLRKSAADVRTEYHYAEWRVPMMPNNAPQDAIMLRAALEAAYGQHPTLPTGPTKVTVAITNIGEDSYGDPVLTIRAEYPV